jgi:hypothetical protein
MALAAALNLTNIYLQDYNHRKRQLPKFSSTNWKEAPTPCFTGSNLKEAPTPQILQLQLEGGSNPLIYRLQPEGSYNSLNSLAPIGRRLQPSNLQAPT